MQEHDADEDVGDGGVGDRGAAHQDGGSGEEAGLVMGVVGGQIAHVLQEDNLARAGQDRGDDDGDDARFLHRNARRVGHGHVLANSSHVLAKLGFPEPDYEDTEQGYDDEGYHGHGERSDVHLEDGIQGLTHRFEVEGVADAVSPGQKDRGVPYGDHRAHEIENEELVNSVYEEGKDVAGDHFPAFGPVHHLSAHPAQENGDGQAHQEGENQALPARHGPVHGEYQADLPCHGAQGHGEVDAHARVDRQEQRYDQEGVAAQAGDHFLDDVVDGELGGTDGRHGDGQENDHDGVLGKPGAY
ncbi:hypothetical protein SDC9_05290 [bioreactor metagenome]|uniref:Uncharacterized protein n=1 Tax=bioreactor metagenome TaxID=1076179 RepID=A0A644SYP3_9ZZZZ